MDNRLYEALEPIKATDRLKENTRSFIQGELARRQRGRVMPLRYAAACCVLLVVLLAGFGGYSLYTTPVSYISVDVNPSVELGLNRLDRVVTVAAYNDDGEAVLQNLSLTNKSYTAAIELLLSDTAFAEYLTDDALLSFTVVSDREETLRTGIQQCRGYSESNAECHAADAQLVDEAHHNGLSLGKYRAFKELSEYDASITPEMCGGMSMRQIRDMIGEHEGENDSCTGGRGHGHGYRGGRNRHE